MNRHRMNLAQNIRDARKAHGLTVADLAQAVGVRENTVYRWERGERVPSIPTLEQLAKAIGSTSAALLTPPAGHRTD